MIGADQGFVRIRSWLWFVIDGFFQGLGKFARATETIIYQWGKCFAGNGIECPRNCDIESRRCNRLVLQNLLKYRIGAAAERPLTGQKLIQNHAGRKYVRASISSMSLVLLRGHVGGRADARAHLGHQLRFNACYTEVRDFDTALFRDHDIGRLYVPMDDAIAVRVFECVENIRHDADDVRYAELLFGVEVFFEFVARDEFHRDEGDLIGLAIFVDGYDSGMIQPASSLGLALETPE